MKKLNKCLLLDRDGVINHDPGDYTCSLEEFIILPHVTEAIRIANTKGYKIAIITNQAGIAKGLYTHETVKQIHDFLMAECQKSGGQIHAIFYSPHHPDYGNSLCRKPASLWVERALALLEGDASQSVMIGDRDRDVEAAIAAGVEGILMEKNGNLLSYVESLP
jgi:D-glycero-D-manno-heptose 1,7-bisphosphate phosphatase